jgi:hypothetical protein
MKKPETTASKKSTFKISISCQRNPTIFSLKNDELVIVLELADAGDLSKMIKHFKSQVGNS